MFIISSHSVSLSLLLPSQFGTPVNPSIRKGESKVVDSVDIEDLGNKAVFCRCWRSSKVRGRCDRRMGGKSKI